MTVRSETPSSPSLPDPPPIVGPMTEEEFVAWCDEETRAEWVDGRVVTMTVSNSEHGSLLPWLAALLGTFVDAHESGRLLGDVAVRLPTQRSRRVPDLVFVSRQRESIVRPTHIEGPPDLAIEIVSPDSEARDWREKYLEYQAAGVGEYWVIDPASESMEAYALEPGEGGPRYRRIEPREGKIASLALPGLALPVAWLWERPRLPDAYRALGLF